MSSIPGAITKIELLDTTTVLHFHLKSPAGSRISVPKKSFIQDYTGGGDKLFVIKAEGTIIGKWHVIPDSGELVYKLYFPKLNSNVKTIDFGEANPAGNWAIYNIALVEEDVSTLPKALRGNWLLADGSNEFQYGFYAKNAILDRAVWNYKAVESKGKKHKITLENNGKEKIVYAKLGKDELVDFGSTPKNLKSYSLKRLNNPNYKLADNSLYDDSIFKTDSTTYSGIIKGYTTRVEEKTGTIYVNNLLTEQQEPYLVIVAEDGSFSVRFSVNYPQSISVRLPYTNKSVFVEPGKDLFHVIDGKSSYFMGDCAQVNSDLSFMESIRNSELDNVIDIVGETAPEDYKKMCFNVRDKELQALKDLQTKHTFSNKALQVKKLDIKYGTLQKVVGYTMYRSGVLKRNKAAKTKDKKIPYKEFTVDNSFYDVIKPEHINNNLAVLSTNYNSFINRLKYSDLFRNKRIIPYTTAEIASMLQESNKELTVDELQMAEMSKEIQTPELLEKEAKFRSDYGDTQQAFYMKYSKDFNKYLKESKSKLNHDNYALNIADYLKEKGQALTDDEIEMLNAIKVMKTDEEKYKEKMFKESYGAIKGKFYQKYQNEINNIHTNKFYKDVEQNMKAFFNSSDSFIFDVMAVQNASKRLQDCNIYSNAELLKLQQKINNPFLANYLTTANESTKAKIELNKTKGGFTVNTVNKTEGDELFDSMIKKFKGKVIYVDFWATWCGPCKSGISSIAPLKEEMKDDDVVFLYITNQTSPENTWKNAIANIKGEHYRVSTDEWNYLSDKFKISGIPHYTLVNKAGEIVKPKMPHTFNNKLKAILKTEIEK